MSWCDVVTLPDGSFGRVTVSDKTVSLHGHWTVTADEPLGFCRAASTSQGVLTIHGGQSDTAWLHGERVKKNLGPCFGVQPVAIDSSFAYVVRSNQVYSKIDLITFNEQVFQHGIPGSSQGISDIGEDGTIWWADAKRIISVDNRKLIYPNVRGLLAVGQFENPDQIVGVFKGTTPPTHFTAFPEMTYEPHLSRSGDKYIICARSGRGPLFVEVPPFPALVSSSPPTPTPVPPPVPPSPLPPMPTAPNVLQTIREVFALHPEIDTKTDVVRGEMTDHVVRALGGRPWGRKDRDKNPTNNNNSDDALCYLLSDGRFEIYDIIDGSTGGPTFNYTGTFSEGENGHFRDVPPLNGPTPVPTPVPTPNTPPPFDPVPVLSAIANLTAQVEGLRIRVKELEETQIVKGHPVEVSGSLSLSDAVRSRKVTWQGFIK